MILTLDASTADFFVHEEILLFFFFLFLSKCLEIFNYLM